MSLHSDRGQRGQEGVAQTKPVPHMLNHPCCGIESGAAIYQGGRSSNPSGNDGLLLKAVPDSFLGSRMEQQAERGSVAEMAGGDWKRPQTDASLFSSEPRLLDASLHLRPCHLPKDWP